MEALYYKKNSDETLSCQLCPHACKLSLGQSGICKVRQNNKGILETLTYNQVSSIAVDPIEKKPLYHFHPGSQILSVGSVGCNLSCVFCQNAGISQCNPEEFSFIKEYTAESLVLHAKAYPGNIGLAFTYNEPVINFEFVKETAALAKSNGLKTVLISNGYINSLPLDELLNYIDAFNIDLKGFSEQFYKRYTAARLKYVLAAIKQIRASGKHLELTNLVITDLNDSPEEFTKMVKWISQEVGSNTVLHISRYYPNYKLRSVPTSPLTLFRLFEIAQQHLKYVYLGNLGSDVGQNTYCPVCGSLAIKRQAYKSEFLALDGEGKCTKCSAKLVQRIS